MTTAADYTNLIQPWKTVGISNNFMFRLVMEDPEICQGVLERLLNIRIAKIKVQIMEMDLANNLSSKGIRLDAYVEDDTGTAYDIEMQTADLNAEALGKRIRYYQSTMDMNLLKKNIPYRQLRRSYIIFICTFDPFKLKLPCYTFINTCQEEKNLTLSDESYKIIYNTTADKSLLTPAQAALLDYINGGEPRDAFAQRINQQVQRLHNEPAKELIYMTYSQTLMEQQELGRQKGVAQGIAQGIAQGVAQGIAQVVLNMLRRNKSLQTIMEDTELSAAEIQAIAKEHGLACS